VKRRLALINLALMAAIAAAGWRLYENWSRAQQREQQMLGWQAKPAGLPAVPVPAPVEGAVAAAFVDIAEKMLFASDRNPNIEIAVAAPDEMPELPIARGVVNLGFGPVALLSPERGQPFKGYGAGETISEFTLVLVTQDEIVLDWQGEQIRKRIAELMVPDAPAAAPAKGGRTESRTNEPTVQRPTEAKGPGADMGTARACQPGDNSPAGTVRDGYRKVVSSSPFGQVCRWVPVDSAP
jgi:hypothetical protein